MHYIHWKTYFLGCWTRGSRGGFAPRLDVTLLKVVWFETQEGSMQRCYMHLHMEVTSILWKKKSVSQSDTTNSKSVSEIQKKGLEQNAFCVEYEEETNAHCVNSK
jgi:hypothetical protein